MIRNPEQLNKVIIESEELSDALHDVLFAIHDIKAKLLRNISPADLAEVVALHSKHVFDYERARLKNWLFECRQLFMHALPDLKVMERRVAEVEDNFSSVVDFFNPEKPGGLLKEVEKVSIDYDVLLKELDSAHGKVIASGIALDKVREKFEKLRKKLERKV